MDPIRRRIVAGIMFLAAQPSFLRSASAADCQESKTFGDWTVRTALADTSSGKREVWMSFETDLEEEQKFHIARHGKAAGGWFVQIRPTDKFKAKSNKEHRRFALLIDGEEIAAFNEAKGARHKDISDPSQRLRNGKLLEVYSGPDAIDIKRYARSMEPLRQGMIWAQSAESRLLSSFRRKQCTPIDEDCYVTTAVCHAVGLADDCWELTTMRRFRDQYLVRRAEGPSQIATYNDVAPALVDAVRRHPQSDAILLRTYWTCILPCAVLSTLGFKSLCHRLYVRHFLDLIELFDLQGLGSDARPAA